MDFKKIYIDIWPESKEKTMQHFKTEAAIMNLVDRINLFLKKEGFEIYWLTFADNHLSFYLLNKETGTYMSNNEVLMFMRDYNLVLPYRMMSEKISFNLRKDKKFVFEPYYLIGKNDKAFEKIQRIGKIILLFLMRNRIDKIFN